MAEQRRYDPGDERVREEVGSALQAHPDIDPSDIELDVNAGVVTLSGSVHERRARQLVEDVVARVPGVKRVANELRVTEGRLDDVLNDFSATGTTPGRGNTGAGGPVPPRGSTGSKPRR